ncbi:SNF2 family N-terminal domain-containing protein [Gymnopilus junonius]|uniref:SNF2 family N-terminal domain-containing protein n=1 Tax=Gymnopilus junonius TaxID=109634 RepID=A0A9P5TQK7_GYMJU|nr:SNF2 family N-terminal domain-containing protein [Gymnopilus junonius]
MADIGPSALAALARVHLNLPPDTSDERVPRFYVDELRRHLSLCPGEHDFRVTLEPGVGYGSVTCLKDGCNMEIALSRRIRVPDGGKRDGFGSLSPFRSHLTSAYHKRKAVKSEESNANASTNTSSSSEAMETAASSRKSLPSSSSAPRTGTAPEPTENIIPRKRLSDVAFDPTRTDEAGLKGESSSAGLTKKVKRESSFKTPFTPVTNTTMTGSSQAALDAEWMAGPYNTVTYDTQDPMVRLDDVRMSIAGQQNVLNQIMYRPDGPTEYDYQRINECQEELARLLALEHHYASMLANTSSSADQNHSWAPIFKSLSSSTAAVTPPMEVDRKPFPQPIASTSQTQFIHYQPTPQIPASYAAPLTTLKDEPEEKKPVAQSSSPASSRFPSVASDNDVCPSSDFPMDDSEPYDSDGSSLAMPGMADFQHIIERVGINVPPPINDDGIDDNGDYHGRGRNLFIGPQAKHDDFDHFLEEASKLETFDKSDSVDKALAELGLQSLEDKFPGMEITLMKHQVLGVAWMLNKEKSTLMGGCLADEMGLGKTVQMMACIVQNRSKNDACKTTLILAPTALLDQWKEEIESKTNCGLKVLIYHGHSKTRKKSEILKHDVVLTTYHTMSSEWPDYENEMKKKAKARKSGDGFIVADSDEEDMKDASYRAQKRKQRAGLLFQVEFYRVIADEAQNIRNRRTRMSRAISDLQATYRWALTGTPIVNTLADVYGLLRFLRIRPWYDWSYFHKEIGLLEKKRPALAVTRLQSVMNAFLLRRKKDSMLDGEKLVDLPPKKVELVKLEFSEEEREVYNMVEARSQLSSTATSRRHRLEELPSKGHGKAFVRPDEAKVKAEVATELTRARRLVSAEFVADVKQRFIENARARMEAEKQSDNATIEEEDCPICYDAMTDAVITSCKHIFCRECIVDVINQPIVEGAEHKADQRPCPVCRALLTEETIFSRQAFEPTEKELNPAALAGDEDEDLSDIEEYLAKDRKGKGKASTPAKPRRSSQEEQDDDDMSDFIVESDEDEEEKDARLAMKRRQGKKRVHVTLDSDEEPEDPEEKEVIFGVRKKVPREKVVIMSRFLPSTKMKYMMEQLQRLVKAKPDEKTLIVSQWTGCLSLVSDYLTEKGIPHVKYQGDMTRPQRDRAVQVFMSKEKARVMLMSLKCGGVGLNLTRANNVISLDLGWSQAVEAQAFDRVHRVGQVRDVLVQRVVIADTVENRILDMQERKQTLADGSLGEGSGKKIGKLSVKELANLFGLDTRGRLLQD